MAHLEADATVIALAGSATKLRNQMKAWRTANSDPDSIMSPETLGAAVHGSVYIDGPKLTRIWDGLEPGIINFINQINPKGR